MRRPEEQNVSRETFSNIARYAALLRQWQTTINLVAPGDLDNLESRHIDDAAQLAPLVRNSPGDSLIDIGSGGGLPGLVLAMLLPERHVTLVESDRRKAAFLTHCVATLQLGNVEVKAERAPLDITSGCITARAVAPLPALIGIARPMLAPGGVCIFPKGEGWAKEVARAREAWHFAHVAHASATDPKAAILVIGNIG